MTILLFLTAISLSVTAAYYAVSGLIAIFAAAVVPIVIMGGLLEGAKLVVASWIYRSWDEIPKLMRSYMVIALVILMLLTSMGIFGFLSKAHIEQSSMSHEQIALIKTHQDKITRSDAKISRWSTDIDRLNSGDNIRVDNLIDEEQVGLDKVYARIKAEKDSLRIDAESKIKQQQLRIDQAQERRDTTVAAAEKKFADSFGGSAEYEKSVADAKEQELSVATRAQNEILNINAKLDESLISIDNKYSTEISTIQSRVQKLRNQANSKTQNIDDKIGNLETLIESEQTKIDAVREEKFVLEKEYRKLEAEVGPLKYIAELIYGESAKEHFDQAVRFVILLIISVFDPLAVLLLIAANWQMMKERTPPKQHQDLNIPIENDFEPETFTEEVVETVAVKEEIKIQTKEDWQPELYNEPKPKERGTIPASSYTTQVNIKEFEE